MAERYEQYLQELMRVHNDWLTPQWVTWEKSRVGFNAKVWVDKFERIGIKNVLFYAKFHDGYCKWPSKYSEIKPERDFVGEITEEASKQGIGVSLYYSAGLDRLAVEMHPEWACLDEDGGVAFITLGVSLPGTVQGVSYPYSCMNNSDYRQYMLNQIKELTDNYNIVGFWLDLFTFPIGTLGTSSRGCFCKHCRKAYVKWSGGKTLWKEAGTREHEMFLRDSLKEVLLQVKEVANADGTRRPVSFNGSGGLGDYVSDKSTISREFSVHRELDRFVDYLSVEGWGVPDPRLTSFNMRLARSDGKPFENISNFTDQAQGWIPKNTDLLILESATITAHGGTYMVSLEPTAEGHIFDYQIEQLAEVRTHLEERRSFLVNTKPVYDVGIWGHKKGGVPQNFSGWGTALMQQHIPFGFLYPDSELKPYPLIIVDGTYLMDKAMQRKIIKYVKEGGKLIVEYNGADFWDESRDGSFEEMLGVQYIGESKFAVNYLGGFEALISQGLPDFPMRVDGPVYKIKPTSARILARHWYPVAPFSQARSTFPGWNAPGIKVSSDAAIIINQYGKGQVVYLGCALGDVQLRSEKNIDGMPHAWPQQLAYNLVVSLIGEENLSFKMDAPPGVEVVFNKQGERYILHLLNQYLVSPLFYSSTRSSLKLSNICVKFNEQKIGRISRICRGVDEEKIPTEREGDWLCLHVPELDIQELFILHCA